MTRGQLNHMHRSGPTRGSSAAEPIRSKVRVNRLCVASQHAAQINYLITSTTAHKKAYKVWDKPGWQTPHRGRRAAHRCTQLHVCQLQYLLLAHVANELNAVGG